MNKTYTLKQNYEFRRLYRRGKSAATKLLVVYALPNRRKTNRFGLTVSVKLGKAVKRNRCKRLLREAYRLQQDNIKVGYDFIFVARSGLVLADCNATQKALRMALDNLKLLER